MREAQLGVAVGKRGIGKSYTTTRIMSNYVKGFGGKVKPRRVLIMDVNDEFQGVKAISPQDIARFSMHPKVEARRIRPFNMDGTKMTLSDISETLFVALETYKGGLLLIEDINKYMSHHFPKDLVGAIVTNRHNSMDIIMHYQAIGKVPTTIWENANWVRFHKNNQSVDRHKKKFEDKYELFKLIECLVDNEYEKGNKHFFMYGNIEDTKINGEYTKKQWNDALERYLSENYRQVVVPESKRMTLDGKSVHKSVKDATTHLKNKLTKKYL
tara:strand:+ start:204 stop:1013 length:810 start_codon:yes stop_codon:yes gene_type:complete